MNTKLLQKLVAISQEQVRLLQIIANKLDDKGLKTDMKSELPSKSVKSEEEKKHEKRSLAAQKAWVTIRANKAKSQPKVPNVADEGKSSDKEQIAPSDKKQEANPSPDTVKESLLAMVPSKANKDERISGTKEWASRTINCVKGCENGCIYCFAQCRKIQLKHLTVENRNIPVERAWNNFVTAFKTVHRGLKGDGTIMFPSTHDITPKTMNYCLKALNFMLGYEGSSYTFLIVSKPWLVCIKRLCDELKDYKSRIMFRFTIGSADDAVLKFWEPYESSFAERVDCVKYAFEQGYKTSISCEPMLDGNVEAVINAVSPYVSDTIWLGYANHLETRLEWNGFGDERYMVEAAKLKALQTKSAALALYARFGSDEKIRWKDSLKELLGIPSNTQAGMDK